MAADYAAVFSAVAAGFSALTALLVYRREWALGRPRCLPPRCYWVGYMDGENGEPRVCMALPLLAMNMRGLSGVLEDIMLQVEGGEWGKPLWFQPELQVDIDRARGTSWGHTQLFVPLVVQGKEVSGAVIIFAHRLFKGDSPARWSRGKYSVVAEETTTYRHLFRTAFELDNDFLSGDGERLTVRADPGIALSPRRWTKEILADRDHRGRPLSMCEHV